MAKGGNRYSANDMRSMAMNPNSSHYHAAQSNHSNQLNPQHPAYGQSREASGLGVGGSTNSATRGEVKDEHSTHMGSGQSNESLTMTFTNGRIRSRLIPGPHDSIYLCHEVWSDSLDNLLQRLALRDNDSSVRG